MNPQLAYLANLARIAQLHRAARLHQPVTGTSSVRRPFRLQRLSLRAAKRPAAPARISC
jgi:hypothetical protein